MVNLIDKKCVGHDQIKLLDQKEVEDLLSQVKDWNLEGTKIKKQFKFDEFMQAIDFVNNIAKTAENEGHHPDIEINYNKVTITLWTHFINGLSENDFIMAAKIDNIL